MSTALSPRRHSGQWWLLPGYVSVGVAGICALVFWLMGSPELPKPLKPPPVGVSAPSEAGGTKGSSLPPQGMPGQVRHSFAPLKLTAAERKLSDELVGALRQKLNVIELENTEVIYQVDSEFQQATFLQIHPIPPENVAAASAEFAERLSAADLRNAAAQSVWARSQNMLNSYTGKRLPYRIIQTYYAKAVKGARVTFGVRDYETEPEVRFTEHGSPFLYCTVGVGTMSGGDPEKDPWIRERYGHLFPLAPGLSALKETTIKK